MFVFFLMIYIYILTIINLFFTHLYPALAVGPQKNLGNCLKELIEDHDHCHPDPGLSDSDRCDKGVCWTSKPGNAMVVSLRHLCELGASVENNLKLLGSSCQVIQVLQFFKFRAHGVALVIACQCQHHLQKKLFASARFFGNALLPVTPLVPNTSVECSSTCSTNGSTAVSVQNPKSMATHL